MYLVYINQLGVDYRGYNLYEFIFSESTVGVDGEDWDVYPASIGNVTPPAFEVISKVGLWETELKLEVISQSDTFCVWDAVDGVVALAYENVTGYAIYPDDRLVFNFGDSLEKTKKTLYSRDITIEIKDIQNEKNKKE
jgi:hypothetical protein